MIEQIKKVLENNVHIKDWKIHEKHIVSEELFFIKKAVDMNRSKDVRHYTVTVYVDVHEDGEDYTGIASSRIHPTMDEEELRKVIDEAAFAASFVKNKAFKIVEPKDDKTISSKDELSKGDLIHKSIKVGNKLYAEDNYDKGCVNSAEVFANQMYHRIINSKGVDVSYTNDACEVEVITQWKENGQDVEIYDVYNFTDFEDDSLTGIVNEQIMKARDKSSAGSMPMLKDIPIIIRCEAIKNIFNYYVRHCNARVIYEGLSQAKVGSSIQGEVKGDYVSITLDPFMENSTLSAPVDEDGMILNTITLITDGVVNTYHGSNQYSSYAETTPTGIINNFKVDEGSKAYADMINEPHIELLTFSAFDMNTITGDFGGEIRLARYFDGEKMVVFSGGSLSANIKAVQEDMYFSKETIQINNYKGPKALTFVGDIAGA